MAWADAGAAQREAFAHVGRPCARCNTRRELFASPACGRGRAAGAGEGSLQATVRSGAPIGRQPFMANRGRLPSSACRHVHSVHPCTSPSAASPCKSAILPICLPQAGEGIRRSAITRIAGRPSRKKARWCIHPTRAPCRHITRQCIDRASESKRPSLLPLPSLAPPQQRKPDEPAHLELLARPRSDASCSRRSSRSSDRGSCRRSIRRRPSSCPR